MSRPLCVRWRGVRRLDVVKCDCDTSLRRGIRSRVALGVVLLSESALMASICSPAAFGWDQAAHGRAGDLARQLQQVDSRLDALEEENGRLRAEVEELREKLKSPAIPPQQRALVLNGTQRPTEPHDDRSGGHPIERVSASGTTEIGFRSGWGTSPYDLPGGVYLGVYADHILFTEVDGVPYGSLSLEGSLGFLQGEKETAQITTLLGRRQARLAVNVIEFEPAFKYRVQSLENLEPYALAGPEIFAPLVESPPLTGGQVSLPPQLQRRGLPTATTGTIEGGAGFGLGFRFSLAQLARRDALFSSQLRQAALGAEWRYHYMARGEQFQQYTVSASLSF